MGAPELILIFIALFLIVIFPVWGYREGAKRSVGATGGLLLGLFLGIIGVIIVFCTKRLDEPVYNYFQNQPSAADELHKYKQLLDNGAITEQEYNIQKGRILNL